MTQQATFLSYNFLPGVDGKIRFMAAPIGGLSLSAHIPSGPLALGRKRLWCARVHVYSARARFLRRNRQVIGSRIERHVSLGEVRSATRKGVALAPFCVATPGAAAFFWISAFRLDRQRRMPLAMQKLQTPENTKMRTPAP